MNRPDAIIVGSGPNGLSAAITLAQAGRRVHVVERDDSIGGGCRTAEITLPGFHHDICSAIHPLALASPFLQSLNLHQFGLDWIQPPIALAHPFDDGSAAIMNRSIAETAASLGPDGEAYHDLFDPLLDDFDRLLPRLLGPLRPTRHPIALGRFGLIALRSLRGLVQSRFQSDRARALLAGMAGHSILDLDNKGTAAFGLVLALFGHAVGWPIPRHGSQSITAALVAHLQTLGATIETGREVTELTGFPPASQILLDLAPRQIASISGPVLPESYRRKLGRYRYGPGVFKIDWALSDPVPWTAPECHQAGTLHLGGSFEEVAASERAVIHGRHSGNPLVLVTQPSRFDPTRAPHGQHTLWAYCHVPNGSTTDMTTIIEDQIERFAPGFRETILARATKTAAEMEHLNPNYVGGDINSGMQDLRQLFTRPTTNFWNPYATPNDRIFICSSATPPGGGVHGMSGRHAALAALRHVKSRRS